MDLNEGIDKREENINFKRELYGDLITTCTKRLPIQTYGLFSSSKDCYHPEKVHIFYSNLRNNPEWKQIFESYGEFYQKHSDAGFVSSPNELVKIEKKIREIDHILIGVFHVHRYQKACPSQVDIDLHYNKDLWCLIISLINLDKPEIKAYWINEKSKKDEIIIKYI